jgi:flagellar hook-associated protein 1
VSTFRSLYTVRSGLDAARFAMDVAGRNVANASTAGYTRQEVSFQAARPSQVIPSAGQGVASAEALRYRDEFLDRLYRSKAGSQGYYDTRSQQLSQVEQAIGDLSEGGLRTALDGFFNAWQTLATNPTQPFARTQVVTAADQFLTQAGSTYNDLAQMRTNMDEALQNKVGELNNAANQIANLNQAISVGNLTQQQTSEMQDRRDLLIDSMAKLAGTTSVKQADGTVTVYLGSLSLVERNTAHPIDTKVAVESDMDSALALTSIQQRTATFTWNGTALPAAFTSGDMKALLELRDQGIPDYVKSLDTLVRNVASQVNTLHTADSNSDGTPDAPPIFNLGPTWMDITLNPAIKADPSLILAAGTVPAAPGAPAPSDGERARAIGNLRDSAFLTGGPVGTKVTTPAGYLQAISLQVGLQVQDAQQGADSASLQVTQAENYRQSVSGVSLDEEMSKMIQFQQTYNAAARMITTIDEMLDVIVNRTGTVGR